MQTFLPLPSFIDSARCLDRARLGKQRVEAMQLLRARLLLKAGSTTAAWSRHPAFEMWADYHVALAHYGAVVCREWIARGYRDTLLPEFERITEPYARKVVAMPWWLGHEPFHAAHRSNLLRKQPAHYLRFHWFDSSDLPYLWPGRHADIGFRTIAAKPGPSITPGKERVRDYPKPSAVASGTSHNRGRSK